MKLPQKLQNLGTEMSLFSKKKKKKKKKKTVSFSVFTFLSLRKGVADIFGWGEISTDIFIVLLTWFPVCCEM